MNRLILTSIVFLWVAGTAQAQFYNNGLITNTNNLVTDYQLPWVNAANGVYTGSGSDGTFYHRGPSAQTFTNDGTYAATAGHTDLFTGPGGLPGAQEIAGSQQPVFYNLQLNNGAGQAISITNTAGILVNNGLQFSSGIVTTVRTRPTAGALQLGAGASYTGGTADNQHVNGYVSKTGNTAFTFPVGSGTDSRTLQMSAPGAATDRYTVAWIAGDPTTTSDPTGTPALHPTSSFDANTINRVSPVGQWDWVAERGTGAGLTVSVSIPDMTTFLGGLNEYSLRLVGWNGTQWINLSTGDKPYLLGTSYASGSAANSTLDGTLVAGITAIGIGLFRTGYPLGGTVFYDGNGLRDGRVEPYGNAPRPLNGTDVDPLTAGAQPLYTTLVNGNGIALLTVPVTTAGTFSFSFVTPDMYSVVLSNNPAGSTVSVLPGTVMSTGERLGSGGGNDGTPDGIATGINLTAASFNEVNFAVDRQPIGKSTQVPPQSTPGSGVQVEIPATAFGGIDLEDGPFPSPENSTYSYDLRGREVTLRPAMNGTVYYAGNPVSTSLVIPGFEPDRVTVSVANAQTTSVSFQYTIRDQAGFASGVSLVSLTFTGPAPSISGVVFDDGNGTTDNLVNGTPLNGTAVPPINGAPVPLYVSLVQNLAQGGTALIATVPVTATGTYNFSNVAINTAYNLVLTTNPQGSATVSSLPTDWVSTGEFLAAQGNDLTVNGILLFVRVNTTPVTGANFGINRRPQVSSATQTARLNPAGAVPVSASLLVGSDLEDGAYPNNMLGRTVSLSAATGGTLFHNGQKVSTVSVFINGFSPSGLTVDPTSPDATTVTFAYQIQDNAGVYSAPGIISVPFVGPTVSLSGTVFDDGNGQTDNTVNGSPINGTAVPPVTGAPVPLYVSLALEATLIATVPVTAAGTYNFSNVAVNQGYNLVLTTKSAGDVINSTLPLGWVNTGAFVGTGPGNTGSFPGVLGVSVGSGSISNANFGIDRRPEGAALTLPPQTNPGGNVPVSVSATAFTGTDLEDGTYANNLTGRAVTLSTATGGTLYYNGTPVSTSLTLASFDPTKVTLDPTAPGTTTATFTYSLKDNAGIVSLPATVTVPFQPTLGISGRVFDDGNGLTDNTVNQIGLGPNPLSGIDIDPQVAGNQRIYAVLFRLPEEEIIATVAVTATGTYAFTGLAAGTYAVGLDNTPTGNQGQLWPGWGSTGEHLGNGPGSDGVPDGLLTDINLTNANIGEANFGINKKPLATPATLAVQANPGGNVRFLIPATVFTGSDLEDGTYPNNLTGRQVRLSAATNATLYYNGAAIALNLDVASFDPTKLTVDPTAVESTTVSFDYTVYDNAGVRSESAGITIPFRPVYTVSGRVFDDGNGLSDNLVNQSGLAPNPLNGTDIDPQVAGPQPIYVVLADNFDFPQVLVVAPVTTAGTYSLTGVPAGTYSLQVSTQPSRLQAFVPSWISTGEHLGNGPGSDGNPDGILTNVQVSTANVGEANFGLDKFPQVADALLAARSNPGGTVQVPVSATAFSGSDLEDGLYANNLTGRRVELFESADGALYYNGALVAGGLTVERFDPTKVTIDPAAPAATTFTFGYSTYDDAGQLAGGAQVTIPFTNPSFSLSGRVFNDGNGLSDNRVNQSGNGPNPLDGTDIDPQVAGRQPIYAVLSQAGANPPVVAVVPVTAASTYSFTGLAAGTYSVSLSTDPAGILLTSLPTGWFSTSEQLGNGPGSDGSPDGRLSGIEITRSDITEANFGINKQPRGADVTLTNQPNPGGSVQVPVSATAFTGSDLEDGTYANNLTGRAVVLGPATGGTLFYNGTPVSASTAIAGFDPTKVTLDPTAPGSTTAAFTYSVRDNVGVASPPALIQLLFQPTFSITGQVFDDGNGMTDNLVNQTGNGPVPLNGTDIDPQVAGKQPIYVVLFDNFEAPQVLRTAPVTTTGTYSFTDIPAGTYSLIVTDRASLIPEMVPGWAYTGEHIGNGPGDDGRPGDGLLEHVVVANANISAVNFGIDKRPQGEDFTLAAQPNPGSLRAPVDPMAFNGNDLEDGLYVDFLRNRRVELFSPEPFGSLYYDGKVVESGASFVVDRFDPGLVSVRPADAGNTTVLITYFIYDNAGVQSEPITIRAPFTDEPAFSLSGRVFNDGNGLTDNLVNQTGLGPNPLNGTDIDPQAVGRQPIYALLLRNVAGRPQLAATQAVTTTGTYSFSGLPGGAYQVALGSDTLAERIATLPVGWAFTGKQLGAGPVSNVPLGLLDVQINNANVSEANFGIDKRPQGADITLADQPNPGDSIQVPVPLQAFTGSDLEDGLYANNLTDRQVELKGFRGGSFFYRGNRLPGNAFTPVRAARFDPTQLTVNPTAPTATTASFTYAVFDDAGVASAPVTVRLPFTAPELRIAGHVFDDGNGLNDNQVNQEGDGPNPVQGHDIDPLQPGDQSLYAVLVYRENGAQRVVDVEPVNDAGAYEFANLPADFEEHHEAYSIFISNDPTGQSQALPQGWASTGEHLGASNGSDGRADGRLYFADAPGNYDYHDANFGIDRVPEAQSVTLPAQRNPGSGVQVTVPTTAFAASDLEDGTYADHLTGRGVTLSIATGGKLYYSGQEVSVSRTIQPFDPTKITVAPAADGATSVRFDYAVLDDAGYPSQPATITLLFTMQNQSISGYVYDDGNGSTDNTINGTGVNGPSLPAYATLVYTGGSVQGRVSEMAHARVAGTVQATVAVKADGSYSFTEVAAGTYSVVLSTNAGGSTTASLPPNWVNTGERLGTGAGNDGTTDGVLTGISVGTANVGSANFGIDRKPVVASGSMPVLSNPGGTNQSPVFASVFAGSDPEDGTYANNLKGREVTLTAAAGGTLYYNGSAVSTASVISSFDPAQVKLDPTAPKQTVATFTVAVKDNAGVLSTPKPIVVPFADNHDDKDENDDPDKDDGSEDPDDDDDGDNDNDGKQDNRTRLPTDVFKPILPTILLPFPIGLPPIFIGILIPTFPINALFIIINGTVYTKDTFPPEGVIVRTDSDGDLEDDFIVEPEDPTKPVPIPTTGIGPTGEPVTKPGNSNIQPATLINNGPLSCTNTTVTLTAGGTGTYRFSSGATQAGGGNTATVSGAGTYYVIVTGPNGYQARAATVVTADQSVPAATLTVSGPLSCSTTSVTLTAGGVGTYRFGAGATQIGTEPTATVTQAGVYEVTVTAANGCKATASVRVVADQSVPAAILTNNGPLSCTNTTVTLTAGGVGTYRFSTGATPVAGGNTATVTEAGIYSVTVTSANGCKATAQTTVNSSGDAPLRIVSQPASGSTVTEGAAITTSVSVTGTGPAQYQWYKDSGIPVAGQSSAVLSLSNVQRTDAGRYFVVVSGPCNGGVASLSSTAFTLTVNPNSLSLTVVATPDTLQTTETTRLVATVRGGTAPYRYTFSGPGIITTTGNTATVASLTAGVQTFTVVASDASMPTNQTISATVSVTVSKANTAPVATINLSQTATVNEDFSYKIKAFTDVETPNSLTYTARISPANGLSFDPATRTISGTPRVVGVSSVTITATDPGSLTAGTTFFIVVRPPQSTTGVVISQIYGAGGEPGATYATDFVELYNRSNATVDISNWSVQYADATGDTWQSAPLTGSIPAGGYYLVQGAVGSSTAVTTSLPPADATGTLSLSGTAGKVALVKTGTVLSGTCPTGADLVDFVGYGGVTCYEGSGAAAGAPTVTMAYFRKMDGCTDTDDNTADFTVSAVLPRNSASPANVCGAVTSLSLTVSASPTTLLTTGTTTLSATVAGGTGPYSYTFTGPGTTSQTPNSNTATASNLTAGVQTFTVVVSDASRPISQTISAYVSVTVTTPTPVNTAPVATTNASQTATVGAAFSYTVNAFIDAQTPNSLTYTASISPANGFTFDPATRVISGVPSLTGMSTITVTATDPGSLSASTSFTITVNPTSISVTAPFAIVGVTPVSCVTLSAGQRRVSFTPLYAGLDGSPVSFSVVSELASTTNPGPYSLNLYTDNPTITLRAVQSGVVSSYAYNWLSACNSTSVTPGNTAPTVVNAVSPQSATVGVGYSLSLANVFTDAQTPNSLVLSTSGLPAGLSLNGTIISGTPSTTVGSPVSVTVTATDPGSLSVSTVFVLTVSPSSLTTTPTGVFAIVGVTPVSCVTLSAGQRRVSFTPLYAGLDGSPVSFSVVSELASTTNPGPYSLNLYTDNPTITLRAVQSGVVSSYAYNWLAACGSTSVTPGNTAPTVVNAVSPQSATVGVGYSLSLANVFTDVQTPNSLVLSTSGLPAGLSLNGTIISGTPSVSGTSSVILTATDAGGLSASMVFLLTVSPSSLTTTPTGGFAIVGVTPVSCVTLSAGQRRVSFTPLYAGLDGSPVSFSVVSELASTTATGPYTLNLYTDNPLITLNAQQSGVVSSYAYNWLSACNNTVTIVNTPPTVAIPLGPLSATVGVGYSLSLERVFTDSETPFRLLLTATGLPSGLNLTASTLVGTPIVIGTSSVTLTATDPGGLSTSLVFVLTVSLPGGTPAPSGSFSITGITPVSCVTLSAGQRRVSFTPQYAGLDGSPVSFLVVSELASTTAAGPYTLNLYTDNPTIRLEAAQGNYIAGFTYNWLSTCGSSSVTPGNTAPTVVNAVSPQSATVGVGYSLSLADVFTDVQTPNSLVLSASGIPAGLSLSGNAITGTPTTTAGNPNSVTLTATDPGGLSVSTSFVLTVSPAASLTVNPPPAGFSITGVQTLSCVTLSTNQRSVTFAPQYAGLTGQAITFSVVNELAVTTSGGPYTLQLYTDNPVITLKASQAGATGPASFSYDWLAACSPANGRRAAEPSAVWQVVVLGNPVLGETVEVEVQGAAGETLQLETVSEGGYQVDKQGMTPAGAVERIRLRVGPSAGVYLLRVSSPGQSQTLKLLRQ